MTSTNVSNGWRWIGLVILLLILLILWLMGYGPSFSGSTPGCCGIPISEQSIAPPIVEPKPSVNLSLQAKDGKIELIGELPSVAEKQKLIQAATAVFGAGNFIDKLTVGANAALPEWWPNLNAILSWLKNGLSFGLGQNGSTLILTGEVESDAVKQAKEAEIKALVGPNVAIDNRMTVMAKAAETETQDPPCSDRMAVTILFANNSAALTDEGKKTLDQVAACLTSPTEVAGHTDSVGRDAFNEGLSRARANAVIDYIGSIDRDKKVLLTPTGYGESKPVANNATEEGRAKNRRIEFTAK